MRNGELTNAKCGTGNAEYRDGKPLAESEPSATFRTPHSKFRIAEQIPFKNLLLH